MSHLFNKTTATLSLLLLLNLQIFAIGGDGSKGNKLCVRNGISNNGDAVNGYFAIEGINNPENRDNEVHIYNRWGLEVFSAFGYDGDLQEVTPNPTRVFRGISDGRATFSSDQKLPSGTYYYTLLIATSGGGEKSQAGYIYIN